MNDDMTPQGQREYDKMRQHVHEKERLSEIDKLRQKLDAANAALESLSAGYKSLQDQYAKTLERLNEMISDRDEASDVARDLWLTSD